jgi:hypothetical protein
MPSNRRPCGGLRRREFIAAAAAAASTLPLIENVQVVSASEKGEAGRAGPLAAPAFPGRVIEARNPNLIRDGARSLDAVRATVAKGMVELTGADDATSAWKSFFEPGDVVGVKMNPVGNPLANSSNELMIAVVEGLVSAGVKKGDVFVYERYRSEFISAGMHKAVPDGVRWGGLTPENEPSQLEISWPAYKRDPTAGYDPDEFVEMNLVHHGHDPKDDRNFRSHLGLLITKRVNKLVLLPVLKDHGSAGVTGALKNVSHGSVNNVARSHSRADANTCNQFIPEVCNHPVLRKKCVLHVMDGSRGVFQKGPFGNDAKFTWEYNALFFATDPVAMDHVEWRIVDAKRKAMNLPPVAATGKLALDPLGTEGFDVRQPQHIALCANLGLGVFEFPSADGKTRGIDHRVVNVGQA